MNKVAESIIFVGDITLVYIGVDMIQQKNYWGVLLSLIAALDIVYYAFKNK